MKKRLLAIFLSLLLLAMPAMGDEPDGGDIPAGDGTDGSDIPAEDAADAPVDVGPVYDMTRGDLTIGYAAGNNASPHPLFCTEWDLVSIDRLMYETLIELDGSMKPRASLATNWTKEEKVWTFTLRRGILFHNGLEMTAYDVAASFEAFRGAGRDNPYYGRTNLIESMTALDDFTLQVNAKYAGYITLYGLVFPVMQQYTLSDEIPSGTGPYWCVSLIYNQAIRLEANPFWWKEQPNLKSVVCIRYPSTTDVLEAFNTGAVDTISARSSAASLTGVLSDVASMTYPTLTYEYLLPNLSSSSIMSDIKMREAVMYAVDMADVVSTGYHSMAQQCEVPIISSSWVYESQSAIFFYSPERAYRNLLDLGWEDLTGDGILNKLSDIKLVELTVNIITCNEGNSTVRETAAKLIASYLGRVGIRAEVEVLSSLEKVKQRIKDKDYDLALLGIGMSEVPGFLYMAYSDGSANLNGYGNSEMDVLIEQSYVAETEDAFRTAMSKVQLKLVQDIPFIGIGFRTGRILSSRSLSGLSGIRIYEILNGIEFMQSSP